MTSILLTLNTHKVAIIGVLTFIVGFVADPNITPLLQSLPPNIQNDISEFAKIAGVILTYLGKPATVKSS